MAAFLAARCFASRRPAWPHRHLNTFSIVRISVSIAAKTKQNIFIPTSVFVSFSHIYIKSLVNDETTGTRDCACINITPQDHPPSWINPPIWTRTDGIVTRFASPFSKVRFHLSMLETERFQKSPLLKPFSKVSVLIGVFGCFSVDDRRKRIFSFENALGVDGALKRRKRLLANYNGLSQGNLHYAKAQKLVTYEFRLTF